MHVKSDNKKYFEVEKYWNCILTSFKKFVPPWTGLLGLALQISINQVEIAKPKFKKPEAEKHFIVDIFFYRYICL